MISLAIPFSHIETPFQRGARDYVVAVRNQDGRIVRTYRYPSKNAALMREHDVQLSLTPEELATHTTEVLPVLSAADEKIRYAVQDLRSVEAAFLVSRGWTNLSGKEDGESWWGPEVVKDQEIIRRERYTHSHAVNSELCHGAPETPELRAAQEAYLRARRWAEADWASSLRSAVNAQKRVDIAYFRATGGGT